MIATASRSRRRSSWAAGIAMRASPSTCSATRRGSSITAAWSPAIGSTSSISGAGNREGWAGGGDRAADHRAGGRAGARLRDPPPGARPRLGAADRPRPPLHRPHAPRGADVSNRGQRVDAGAVLAEAGLEPLRLEAKEALSLMNGTSVMTALGCIAFRQSLRLARLAAGLTAMASDLIRGNQAHFDGRLFAAKPHPGQLACARWIAEDIAYDERSTAA